MANPDDVVYGAEDEVTVGAPQKSFTPTFTDDSNDSLLDQLAEVAQQKVEKKVRLEIDPDIRPGGWVLEFRAVIDAQEIRQYQRAATNNGKKKPEDADNVKANSLPLLQKNTGIYLGDKLVTDKEGDPVTLTSFEFLKMMGEKEGNPDAIRALQNFLGDAQIFSMGAALLKAAGYGTDMAPVDPT